MKTQCAKCGFESEANKLKNGLAFCEVCIKFAPSDPIKLDEYTEEKIISPEVLEPLRKFSFFSEQIRKKGMIKKAAEGKTMSRPPFGYKMEGGKLIPSSNFREVREIFEEFLSSENSLNNLAKKRGFSVNGLKKILFNFTYLGKIKFNGQVHEGEHTPLLSPTLFNHVQNKLEQRKIKKP
jgi:hypothetical protein